MPVPAMYWNKRIVELNVTSIQSAAKSVMEGAGLTNIKVKTNEVTGKTSSVHAAIGHFFLYKPDSGSRDTNSPGKSAVIFFTAGQGSKELLKELVTAWDNFPFL